MHLFIEMPKRRIHPNFGLVNLGLVNSPFSEQKPAPLIVFYTIHKSVP